MASNPTSNANLHGGEPISNLKVISFTGPENLLPEHISLIEKTLQNYTWGDRYVSGAAHGVDTVCALEMLDLCPEAEHQLIVPNYRHNEDLVELWVDMGKVNPKFSVIFMPRHTGPLDRNTKMVELSTHQVAFPESQEEKVRSGTWSTIRRARKKGIPTYFYPLSGTPPWTERVFL